MHMVYTISEMLHAGTRELCFYCVKMNDCNNVPAGTVKENKTKGRKGITTVILEERGITLYFFVNAGYLLGTALGNKTEHTK